MATAAPSAKPSAFPLSVWAHFQPLSPIHSLTHLLPLRSALLLGKASLR